jgi:hypothetical protein
MEFRTRSAAGTWMFLTTLPAFAQESTTAKASSTTGKTSCPPDCSSLIIPSDPTWFVAGFIAGLAVGIVAAKAFGGKKQQ